MSHSSSSSLPADLLADGGGGGGIMRLISDTTSPGGGGGGGGAAPREEEELISEEVGGKGGGPMVDMSSLGFDGPLPAPLICSRLFFNSSFKCSFMSTYFLVPPPVSLASCFFFFASFLRSSILRSLDLSPANERIALSSSLRGSAPLESAWSDESSALLAPDGGGGGGAGGPPELKSQKPRITNCFF